MKLTKTLIKVFYIKTKKFKFINLGLNRLKKI